jgi:signal transduction histidine kinase
MSPGDPSSDLRPVAFDRLPHAAMVVGLCGRILLRNPVAERMLPPGLDVVEAIVCGSGPDALDWRAEARALDDPDSRRELHDVWIYQRSGGQILVDLTFRRLGVEPVGCASRGQMPELCEPCDGVLVLVHDVSQRASMERRLAASERLAAVGKLSAQVAHQLNTPLDGILRYIGLAQRSDPAQADGFLEKARSGLMRMASIIRDLAQQGRIGDHATSDRSLRELLDEVLVAMQPSAQSMGVEFAFEIDPVGPCRVDGNLFHIFGNIVRNALDAMAGPGRLTIRIRREGDSVLVEFEDTGPGLGQADPEVLFAPFYTSKRGGEGSGLGLAIARELAQRMGGSLRAADADGGGAVFTLELPAGEAAWAQPEMPREVREDA